MKMIRIAIRGLTALALLTFTASGGFAQPAPNAPSFEVASVKPAAPSNDGHIMRRMGDNDPGMVNYGNVTLKMLIVRAYNVKDYQISGPEWLDSAGYDVVAKIPAGSSQDDVRLMFQNLLAERFKLALHRESRNLPVYALVVGKGGPKLKEADPNAPPPGFGNAHTGGYFGPGGAPPPPPPPGAGAAKGGPVMLLMMGPRGRQFRGQATMSHFVNMLSNFVDRPVLDETGLTKTYDIDITWAPDETDRMQSRLPMPMMAGKPGDTGPTGAASASAPGAAPESKAADAAEPVGSIFSVLQSLGLKLEPRKSPAEILVIDHAEKTPTEN